MAGLTVTIWPEDQIMTIEEFAVENDLTAEVIETRDGKWYAKISAYTSAHYSSSEQRMVSRQLIVTKQVKGQALAQAELAAQLTALNTIELADGTKVDISSVRVTPGSI